MVSAEAKARKRRRDKERNRKLTEIRNIFKNKRGCETCGSKENLELHHPEPHTKGKEIVRIKNIRKLDDEMRKTQVLCAECHKKIHYPKKFL